MNSDELRELADALMEHAAHERQVAHDCDCRPEDTHNWRIHVDCVRAAEFLRECAQAEPVHCPPLTRKR